MGPTQSTEVTAQSPSTESSSLRSSSSTSLAATQTHSTSLSPRLVSKREPTASMDLHQPAASLANSSSNHTLIPDTALNQARRTRSSLAPRLQQNLRHRIDPVQCCLCCH